MNKRGQGLSTSAIILIILGIVVLVFLIFGFTIGWSNITPFLKSSNVDSLEKACALACSLDYKDDFCNVERKLNIPDTRETETLKDGELYTCFELVEENLVGDCPSIKCVASADKILSCVEDFEGKMVDAAPDGTCPAVTGSTSEILPGPFSDQEGIRICCKYTPAQ